MQYVLMDGSRYQGNEDEFLKAYPEAEKGHSALLESIKKARRERGDLVPRK